MKSFLAASLLLLSASAVSAADVTVKLTEQDLMNWSQITSYMDKCATQAAMHANLFDCQQVGAYLAQFAGRVQAANTQALADAAKAAEAAKSDNPAQADEKK